MTIYTPSGPEKKDNKDLVEPEVVSVSEPLTSFKDEEGDEAEVAPKLVRVTYFPRSRRTFCIHLLLTIMVLVILACGAIGAVVFYRHWNKKQVYSFRCGTVYFDEAYHRKMDITWAEASQATQDYLEERIDVSQEELYESLYTPQFDEVRETYVWHDFNKNYTALIEHKLKLCYVMKLNRTLIAPPKDLIDLLNKVVSGYYLPEAKVLRENYSRVVPALTDLSQFGNGISSKCKYYNTYWLMKYPYADDQRKKRAAKEEIVVKEDTYAILSNRIDAQTIVKINVRKN